MDENTLNILDLFSGSGSWVKNWRNNTTYNIHIDSVDIEPREHVNILTDARDFKPTKIYHIVYSSCPCNHFSRMRNVNKEKSTEEDLALSVELADISFRLGKKAKYAYVIENPATGLMPKLYEGYQLVDYSEYGYPLRKRTAIWSNLDLKLKTRKRGDVNYNTYPLSYLSKDEKWSIPKKLADYIKWVIIKKYMQEFKQFHLPGLERDKINKSKKKKRRMS